jgi:hypothetical protein
MDGMMVPVVGVVCNYWTIVCLAVRPIQVSRTVSRRLILPLPFHQKLIHFNDFL